VRSIAVVVLLGACGRFGFGGPAGGDGGADGTAPPDRPNRIFVSSVTADGNLGGLPGADAICQGAADTASLGGSWRAVLWTASAAPSARFAGSRGWVDLQGLAIADLPADLDAATINPLRVDENTTVLSDPSTGYAWYGGTPAASETCADWTTNTGGIGAIHEVSIAASFDTDTYSSCPSPRRLICAETGHVAEVRPAQETGRVVFITGATWVPTGGLVGADAFCQGEADGAGVVGTFRAFLPTATASAESRFSAAGLPWRRVDGERIVAAATDLVGPSPVPFWKSFIARTASGAETKQRVWTGTAAQNCNNWNGGSAQVGTMGESMTAWRASLQLFSNVGCTSALPLICLEQ
jgi:hypothetical protein